MCVCVSVQGWEVTLSIHLSERLLSNVISLSTGYCFNVHAPMSKALLRSKIGRNEIVSNDANIVNWVKMNIWWLKSCGCILTVPPAMPTSNRYLSFLFFAKPSQISRGVVSGGGGGGGGRKDRRPPHLCSPKDHTENNIPLFYAEICPFACPSCHGIIYS